ncbi:MAG: polymerase sigma factor RpoD, partial [Cyanobacteriota bacterium]
MSPAATKTQKAKPEILMVANSSGETIQVVKPKATRSRARKEDSPEGAVADGADAANKVTPTKAKATKAKAASTKTATTKAATTKAAGGAAVKAAGSRKTKAEVPADLDAAADALLSAAADDEGADAKAAEKDAKAKALASIKVGPKGVYTEDSIRVYLQEIGRIRLLRPDEEIELARKIADLLQLEELAAQFETDHGHFPDTKEWAVLVDMPLVKFRRRLMLGRRAKEKMVQSNL